MNKQVNTWTTFTPIETKESRFGVVPEGEHVVEIIAAVAMQSSQNFKLNDDMTPNEPIAKIGYDLAFNQDILAVIYKDSQGRVLIDRRSSIGWARQEDVTPDHIAKYGLKASGQRFLRKDGTGMPSGKRTEKCTEINSRLFNAAGANNMNELIGKNLKIVVIAKAGKQEGQKNMEVKGYYKADAIINTAAKEPSEPAQTSEEINDLPF